MQTIKFAGIVVWGRDEYLWHGTVKCKKQNNSIARVTVFKSNLNSCHGWLSLHLQINIKKFKDFISHSTTGKLFWRKSSVMWRTTLQNFDSYSTNNVLFTKQNSSKCNGTTKRQLTSFFSIAWINQIEPQFWRERFCLIREIRATITLSLLKWGDHKEDLKW